MRNGARRIAAGLMALLAGGCVSVPLDYPRTPTTLIADTGDTALAHASAAWRQSRPDQSGFYPLVKGLDAFGARLALADRAEVSIDAQYFLIKPDDAGLAFAAAMLRAADRGVRVRLLLDDVFTTVDDTALALLDAHPNIELRIFNPVSRKGLYALNYAGNFKLANRRMHNKSFIVDNQVAVVGGRNIAVEYFQLETGGEFIDFDMLAAGPIVGEVSASFDTYWNDELAMPMEALHGPVDARTADQRLARGRQRMDAAGHSIYAAATDTDLMRHFLAGTLPPYSAQARMIVDDPQKLRREIADEHKLVATEIARALQAAEQEAIIFTPYFIPGKAALGLIRAARAKGVRIVLVTNSLATNNHTAVHSAYSGYRKEILQEGVELWEARADAAASAGSGDSDGGEPLTMHTKGILIDRRRVFVGSLNLDPRAIDINTEMGLMIESEALAATLADVAAERLPAMAYRLALDERGSVTWRATIDGREVVETKEPQTSAWQRFKAFVLKIAPEKQL